MLHAYNERKKAEWTQKQNLSILTAYMTVAIGADLQEKKKIQISDYWVDENAKPQKEQTPEDMLATVRVLNAAFGGKETVKPGTKRRASFCG